MLYYLIYKFYRSIFSLFIVIIIHADSHREEGWQCRESLNHFTSVSKLQLEM